MDNYFNQDLTLVNVLIAVIVTIIAFYYFSTKTFNFWKNRNVKYCQPTPFFGNTMSTMFRKKSNVDNQQDIYNSFPEERYVGMFMFRTPMLMVRDPQLINCILSKDFVHFYDRGISVDERVDLLSLHLVNLRGKNWKHLRNKLTPAFSSGKLKAMGSLLEDCCDCLTDYLQQSFNEAQVCHDVREVMAKFATDVIGSCAFGVKFNSLKDPNSEFRRMGIEVFKPTLRFIVKFIARTIHSSLPYYLNLKAMKPEVENFFLDFVKKAIIFREKERDERKDFLQILINMRKEDYESNRNDDNTSNSVCFNDQLLASNVFVFFLAGFETTSSTMSFLLLELAANPEIQEVVRAEILQALQKQAGNLNYETIKELPYMDKVIAETLRKYPIATALLRECTETYQVPGDSLIIEKGTRVLIPVYAIHHDPSHYANPDKFDPERFSQENKAKRVQGTYLPFGDGPRICIGLRFAMMEMKYAFCKIIPKFEFSLNESLSYPVIFKKGAPLLAPEDGIWLNVHRRM